MLIGIFSCAGGVCALGSGGAVFAAELLCGADHGMVCQQVLRCFALACAYFIICVMLTVAGLCVSGVSQVCQC
jgi:hypothetical protein